MEDEYNNYGTNDSGEVVTTPNNSRDVDSDTSRSAKDITVISLVSFWWCELYKMYTVQEFNLPAQLTIYMT